MVILVLGAKDAAQACFWW